MTPERLQRINDMLALRQTDLTVLLEEVHKPHNVSAIIRSCDAVGVQNIHTVWFDKVATIRPISMGAHDWIDIHSHRTVDTAITTLKGEGKQVLVTHLSDSAIDFRDVDYTKPTAIIFGQERFGATEQAIAQSDQDIVIPMMGMTQSLNVSVAAALILYEAQRQRQKAGMYENNQLPDDLRQRILFRGGHSLVYKQWQEHGELPYPEIDEQGEIVASDTWWQALKQGNPNRQ
ncbi:tRNA (guanosine(18)-2'-O)-methyltransferase TrmH [Opacimonas viscosa]|uniref:tRNA (guanosine(18)-2'-O)-methyltransferase n=1 Tax=Opacimonas viscosa TaxID=2961944 RepID=A0AA42BLC9_9ALTE|nr:tRNA (guanosine(18)-2'-O)-methyltransferase TrmH [Opacimonas viscosa]MCP3428680.1 tRNA (guanosine(18)-2'-O)-methyltransferase TrmH [Opacimonas viscosa]